MDWLKVLERAEEKKSNATPSQEAVEGDEAGLEFENAYGVRTDKTDRRVSADSITGDAEVISSAADVFELARMCFPGSESLDLPVLPPIWGRDPLVHKGTDKVRFFRGDWRKAGPADFKPYEGSNA